MHEVVNTCHNTGYQVLQCHFRVGGSGRCWRDPSPKAVPTYKQGVFRVWVGIGFANRASNPVGLAAGVAVLQAHTYAIWTKIYLGLLSYAPRPYVLNPSQTWIRRILGSD